MVYVNQRINHAFYRQITRQRFELKASEKCLSTTSHPIISRRAVDQFLKNNKDHPLNTIRKKTETKETPWPRSLQLLGYGAMVISVPFCIGAGIVELPSFRRFMQGGDEDQIVAHAKPTLGTMCVNAVREFWAGEEVTPDEEQKWLLKQSDAKPRKSFDNEDSTHVRQIQQEIGKLSLSPQRFQITTYPFNTPETSGFGEHTSSDLTSYEGVAEDGKMILGDGNSDDIRKNIMRKVNTEISNDDASTPIVAIEFLDDEKDKQDSLYTDTNDNLNIPIMEDFCDDLRNKTATWSSWQYFPKANSSSLSENTTRLSDDDVRKSELDWKIQEVKQQLTDPTCLRDIDEMQDELKSLERQLRKIKRKWILF